ncbi:PRC-barrel domain-containing protein [Amaricoccus sp.]|uniref:PRC-barrel domain-containing protein n=1 Tax=Amaricoccus sp. TaxID=1872485 RepID=UPI001B77CE28|nr:PRC-barrel domain-containing protein [Amaricoccus sp.]MBP7000361.1 PRC-barrel domain-containing protein [Amaricoccus sp.]
MFKTALAFAAVAALMTVGAQAQTQPADPAAPATPPAVAPAPMEPAADPMVPEGYTAAELSTISTDQLIGANLVNHENETVASIDDVLITDANAVEGVVVTFGGVLGFGANKVLLQPDEIQVLKDANGALIVRTSLTPESIESRPLYEG